MMIPSDPEDQPLEILRTLEDPAPPGFLTKVRNSVDRRVTSAQLVSFSWNVPKTLFLEMAFALTDLGDALGAKKGTRQ